MARLPRLSHQGDWVLIYRINEDSEGEEIIFVRTGTHADLFE
ncbi:MAG TPA: type II toxin-antitoxin system YafQ family toxin [Burkholderiales bacterium]|nr:type II toxin-antitoxin system YafQ family toxin [Burkholderiales bacterium]